MAESAGDLTFAFGADFSSFTREVDSAGARLDALSKAAAGLTPASSRGPLRIGGFGQAAGALAGDDDQARRTLSRLADQLALVQTTGAAHDAIVAHMKVETEQARLGTDATLAQKQAVASLVGQIDAAKASQKALAAQQAAVNEAWSFGADAITRGLDGVILRGQRLQDVARSLLTSFARQGLEGALTGGGAFAGLFGTAGQGGRTGGLFGALQGLFSGGLGAAGPGTGAIDAAFAGLYAGGGTIGAGRWGIVGERGAEVVAGPATVTPWSRLPRGGAAAGAGAQTINFNVTTPDAPSFARSETQIAAVLARAVGRGQRNG